MVFLNESARGNTTPAPKPKPQRIAKQTTISAAPRSFMAAPTASRPKPAPKRSAPRPIASQPTVSPVRSNSTGQVSSPSPQHKAMQNRVQQQQNQKQGKPQPKPNNKPQQKNNDKPTAAPKVAPGKVQPVGAPSIDDYLSSDTGYQGGVSELMKTLEQFKSGNQASQQDVQSAFKTAMERMGQEREQSLKSLQDDFASRGLLNSGLYAQANSDYDTQYNQRVGDLTKDEQNQLGSLNTDQSNFEGLNQTQQAALKAEAIRRRADKYNITA